MSTCNRCGKWNGAHATLPGQPRDHLCHCQPPARAAVEAAQPEAVGEPTSEPKRCGYCDGTGDVHSPDGEWRGRCSCPAGGYPTTPYPAAPTESQPAEADERSERDRFEVAYCADVARRTHMDCPLSEVQALREGDHYTAANLNGCWQGWRLARALTAPTAPAPIEPVAWAIFTDAGNARMWTTFQPHLQKLADAEGLTVTPLYATPPNDGMDAARWRAFIGLDYELRAEWATNLSLAPILTQWVDNRIKFINAELSLATPPSAAAQTEAVGEHAPCKGTNCGITRTDQAHSPECYAEHAAACKFDPLDTPGNRHREYRYAGYKGRPLKPGCTADQAAAYREGVRAAAPTTEATSSPSDADRWRVLVEACSEEPLRPAAYANELMPDTRLKISFPTIVSLDAVGNVTTLADWADAAIRATKGGDL